MRITHHSTYNHWQVAADKQREASQAAITAIQIQIHQKEQEQERLKADLQNLQKQEARAIDEATEAKQEYVQALQKLSEDVRAL